MSEIESVKQSLLFNYNGIDTDTTTYLKQNAQETRGLLKRTSEDIIKIGKNLLEAKARLPHGQFIPWVKAELNISQSTSWRFMQAAQGNPVKSFKMNDFIPQIEATSHEVSQEDGTALADTIIVELDFRNGIESIWNTVKENEPENKTEALGYYMHLKNWFLDRQNEAAETALRYERLMGELGISKMSRLDQIERNLHMRFAEGAIEIGKILLEVATVLDHTHLLNWAKAIHHLDEQDVMDLIASAEKGKSVSLENLSNEELRVIGAPFIPVMEKMTEKMLGEPA